MKTYDTIVVGGGLAGLSAAYYISKKGKKVLLLEKQQVIGGRTASWTDKNGMAMESGLHRMLGFYEELPKLMEECGIDINKAVIWEDELEIRLKNGIQAEFGLSLLKPVKSLMTSLGNNDFLSPKDKLKLASFFTQGFLDLKKEGIKLDEFTLEKYALKKSLPKKVIFRVLTPLTEGLFFIPPKKYSAYMFFALFEPYLTKFYKTRAGAFSGGMTDVMTGPIAEKIKRLGSMVITDSIVDKLLIEKNSIKGVTSNGKSYYASNVVLSTGIKDASNLLNISKVLHEFSNLPTMPSMTVQFELKEPSLPKDRVTFSPGTLFASYSEQSRTTFKNTKGRLSVILSQSDKYLKIKPETIVRRLITDASKVGINLTHDNITRYQIVKWEHDFYSYECGNTGKIPPFETSVEGLYLAGDYTDQKYMQTMEGAVYSGRIVAELI